MKKYICVNVYQRYVNFNYPNNHCFRYLSTEQTLETARINALNTFRKMFNIPTIHSLETTTYQED